MSEHQDEIDEFWCTICQRPSLHALDHDAEAHEAWAASR